MQHLEYLKIGGWGGSERRKCVRPERLDIAMSSASNSEYFATVMHWSNM